MRYAIVIELADGTYSAYVPDLPGCVSTGSSVQEVEDRIREAIQFHIEELQQEGLPVPAPSCEGEFVEVEPADLEMQPTR